MCITGDAMCSSSSTTIFSGPVSTCCRASSSVAISRRVCAIRVWVVSNPAIRIMRPDSIYSGKAIGSP